MGFFPFDAPKLRHEWRYRHVITIDRDAESIDILNNMVNSDCSGWQRAINELRLYDDAISKLNETLSRNTVLDNVGVGTFRVEEYWGPEREYVLYRTSTLARGSNSYSLYSVIKCQGNSTPGDSFVC